MRHKSAEARAASWQSELGKAASILVMVAALLLFLPGTAHALTGTDVTITLITGNSTTGVQELVLDSNSPCVQGPDAAYVGFQITNTSGGTLTGLSASLGDFDTAAGFNLTGGQAASQYIGTLDAGESRAVYWYTTYPCTDGLTDTVTITVSDDNPGTVTDTADIVTTSSISASAGGQIQTATLGPGYVVGQVIVYSVEYSFGNVQSGDDFYLQPTGEPDFDAGCFQLIRSEVASSGTNAVVAGTVDRLHFQAAGSQGGTDHRVVMDYSFLYLCSGASTEAVPYAAQTSGVAGLKYTGNYGTSIGGGVPTTLPEGDNPFTVDKSVTPNTLSSGTGGTVTYTVTVTNTSDYDSFLSKIEDTLPTGFTFNAFDATSDVDTTNSSDYPSSGDGGTLSFVGIPLTSYVVPATGSIALVYTANVPSATADGSYDNTAEGFSDEESIGTDTATVVVGSSADLSITKTDSADPVDVNDSFSYTITVTNGGPDTAVSPTVTDTIPGGVGFDSATPDDGSTCDTYSAPTLTCTLNDIASGDDVAITVNVTAPSSGGTITNSVEVSSSTSDADSDNNSVDEETTVEDTSVPTADLELTKTVTTSGPYNLGDTVTFEVTLLNNGPDTATNVTVSDTIPAGLSGVTVTPGATSSSSTATTWTAPTWTIPSLLSTESATLTISGTLNTTTTVTNTAEVTASDQADSDSTPNNNVPAEDDQDSASVDVEPAADLSLSKTVDDPAPLVGDTVEYSISLTNGGPDTATGVVVTDTLPAGVSYAGNVSVPAGTTFDGTTWDVGTLAAGTITLVFNATVTASGEQVNVAELTAADQYDPDSDPGNADPGEDDQDSVALNGTEESEPAGHRNSGGSDGGGGSSPPAGEPTVSITGAPPSAGIGDPVTWTIVITNPGDTPTDPVVFSDTLPSTFDVLDASSTQGSVSVVGNLVRVDVGVLLPGAMVTILVNGQVSQLAEAGEVCSVAQANTVQAEACIFLLPDQLPDLGGQPVRAIPAWILLVLIVAGGLLTLIRLNVKQRFTA